ncbi:MAG: hypothetical protein PUD82_01170 [Coriobacteriaceae bacterium]|nr:hypothetical protein [Coriobacteriaceae bacterium]
MNLNTKIDLKDLGKNLSLKKLKGSKGSQYPSKTSINLAMADDSTQFTPRTAVMLVLVLLFAVVFCKFAVIDVMGAASQAESRVSAAQAQLSALQAANADYNEVQAAYDKIGVSGLSADERALADRGDVIELIEKTASQLGSLQAVRVSGNTMELQFSDRSLHDVSRLMQVLESKDIVAGVSVSMAKTDEKTDVVSVVTVTLQPQSASAAGAAEEN